MYTTIFLRENEKDIFQTLKDQGIDTTVFEHYLADLFNRVYNNFVGYYLFKQDNIVYKIVVLPKTIKPSETAEKEFVNYLLHYYRINNIYKFDKTKQIPNSLLQLAFESTNSEDCGHELLEYFQTYRYKALLQSIENFFKKHKNSKRVKVDYISQSIKHRLNLKKNIKELDKTKIHQIQSKDVIYSLLATVTFHALELFVSYKIDMIANELKEELINEVKKLQNILLKKYYIERGYKVSIAILQGLKVEKIFSKTTESKQLLMNIKSLFGFEQMYKESAIQIQYRQDLTTNSFFIDPIYFYEWYVYDILKNYAQEQALKILFDKDQENNTTIKYDLSSVGGNDKERSSHPDYILIDEQENIKIVLDAKWKNVTKLGDIHSSDFLKLKHDAVLLNKGAYKTIPYLVYPQYITLNDKVKITVNNDSYFHFNVLQIDMNFKERDNSIDFSYDYNQIQKEVSDEIKNEKLESIAQESSEDIQDQRNAIIEKILNSDTLVDKEAVFASLEKELLVKAENLSDSLEEYVSPKIRYIIEKYGNILEPDSKKFLKSSSSIYNYYKDKNYEHFDYSMPGSGLWKLVELELNSSFVWYIRILKNICDKNSKTISLLESDESFKIGWVELNEYERNSNCLKSLMLGQIKFLAGNKGIKKQIKNDFISDELFDLLKNIIAVRNEHAHIKAMSLKKFEQLSDILFGTDEGQSNIIKLLEFKKKSLSL